VLDGRREPVGVGPAGEPPLALGIGGVRRRTRYRRSPFAFVSTSMLAT
jgi:hypothetical protein